MSGSKKIHPGKEDAGGRMKDGSAVKVGTPIKRVVDDLPSRKKGKKDRLALTTLQVSRRSEHRDGSADTQKRGYKLPRWNKIQGIRASAGR